MSGLGIFVKKKPKEAPNLLGIRKRCGAVVRLA